MFHEACHGFPRTPSGVASGLAAVIDDFAHPAWADTHEQFAADVAAGLARLGRWLRRRARAKDEPPVVIPHRGKAGRPQPRTRTR